jgi:hypothetical protein
MKSLKLDGISDENVKATMLEAATVLRMLKIVLDAIDDAINGGPLA